MEPRFISWNVAAMQTFDFTFPDSWSRKKIKAPPSRRPGVSADVWIDVYTPADDWSRLKWPGEMKVCQRMLISSFKLTNGTLITPLFNFYLDLGLPCTKIHRFVQYTLHKVFNSFVQYVVDARRAYLDAMQKMIEFYRDKGIDMLKLDCTLPNLANICLHKSTDYKFYPFFSRDSDLLEKIREDMTGGPSIVFTRKAVANETFIRKSKSLGKSIVGIDASQLYPFSMC